MSTKTYETQIKGLYYKNRLIRWLMNLWYIRVCNQLKYVCDNCHRVIAEQKAKWTEYTNEMSFTGVEVDCECPFCGGYLEY